MFYSTTASTYEELYGEEQRTKHRVALKALAANSLGKVLDVGCGPAAFLREIASSSSFQVGVDISHEMLARARQASASSIFLICCDADFIPLRDGFFDYVFAFTLLQNTPNPSLMLGEILRTLKTDGIFVLTLPVSSRLGLEATQLFEETRLDYRIVDDPSSKDHIFICRRKG